MFNRFILSFNRGGMAYLINKSYLLSVLLMSIPCSTKLGVSLWAEDLTAGTSVDVAVVEQTAFDSTADDDQSTAPVSFLGREVGTDFELADWSQVSGFYQQLASQSERVMLQNVGKTSEGRDFLVAILSDKANLERLDEIKHYSKQIADPRGLSEKQKADAINNGKVIVFITPSMHATEVAATEMAMKFAWLLATSDQEPWKSARRDAVVIITPSLNPDGVDHVVHWYRQHVGTPLEASSLNRLYQLYTGHDNNRDWFMLTQVETRLLSQLLYQQWHPQFLWDVHQQGSRGERFFVPPYRDPLNPNFDPAIVAGINLIGTRAVMDMTRQGLTGIATGISYDNWWNGGNRSVPGRHHIIGILTEAASAKIASPIFQTQSSLSDPLGTGRYQASNQFLNPWPGGWWRMSDIIEYELAFGRSLLGSVTREPKFWLRNKMEAVERTLSLSSKGPAGWLIPIDNADRGATRRLVDALQQTGVEIHVSTKPFVADGKEYAKGTLVISSDQPYGNYVKDLFELQRFPPGTAPYDVTGWTLPLLLGVRRVEVRNPMEAELELVNAPEQALAGFNGDPRVEQFDSAPVVSSSDSDSWKFLVKQLIAGQGAKLLTSKEHGGLIAFPRYDTDTDAPSTGSVDKPLAGIDLSSMPRIGIYAPWSASIDEGWLRWVFDYFEVPFTSIRPEQIRAGNLAEQLDVLLMPSLTKSSIDQGVDASQIPSLMAGGIDPEGSLAVEAFVSSGGTLITMDSSCDWAIDLFQLPVVDVTKSAKGFSCPGSVLRGIVLEDPLTAGLPRSIPLFFSGASAWRLMTKTERDEAGAKEMPTTVLANYAPTRLLLSGYIEGAKTIEGQGAWVSLSYDQGKIHLFGFRPHYRAWTQATFHLLFRAMMFDSNRS